MAPWRLGEHQLLVVVRRVLPEVGTQPRGSWQCLCALSCPLQSFRALLVGSREELDPAESKNWPLYLHHLHFSALKYFCWWTEWNWTQTQPCTVVVFFSVLHPDTVYVLEPNVLFWGQGWLPLDVLTSPGLTGSTSTGKRLCCRKSKLTFGCATNLSAEVYISWKESWEMPKSDLSEQLLWKLTHITISNWGHSLKCCFLLPCFLWVDPGCFKVPCTHSLL